MSSGWVCRCPESTEPMVPNANRKRSARLWRVTDRNCNYSAFNGYKKTWSPYSQIICLRCGALWRSKARYVAAIPDAKANWHKDVKGGSNHEAAMKYHGVID